MEVRNRDGDPVDPVPFLVSTAMTVLLLFSLGPLYCQAYGAPMWVGLAVATVGTAGISTVAYHRLVWTAPPPWVTISPGLRFRGLIYIGLAVGLLLLALSVPLTL